MKTKLKLCSVCARESILWKSSPALCQSCARKQATLSAIERSKGEHGHTTLKSGEGVAKPFPAIRKFRTAEIKKVSTRMQKLNAQYEKARVPYLKANPFCKAGMEGCQVLSSQVHHRRGRGEYYLRVDTWMPVCCNCHTWINEHNEAATEKGFCQSRLSKAI